jgi:hypothetical protein
MNPEDFSRLLDRIFDQWNQGTPHAPLFACLPELVIERLRAG